MTPGVLVMFSMLTVNACHDAGALSDLAFNVAKEKVSIAQPTVSEIVLGTVLFKKTFVLDVEKCAEYNTILLKDVPGA